MKVMCTILNGYKNVCIKDILNECNYGNYCYHQSVLRNVNLSKNVMQFLHEKIVEDQKSQIFYSPKCVNYKIYKSDFSFEKYLTVHPPDLMYNHTSNLVEA